MFCNQLFTNPNPLLGDLVYEPDKPMQTMLNEFIQNNVFIYQEEGQYIYYALPVIEQNTSLGLADYKNLAKLLVTKS